ncbi:MAG: G5 domain-containing protein [Bacillota bacterium]
MKLAVRLANHKALTILLVAVVLMAAGWVSTQGQNVIVQVDGRVITGVTWRRTVEGALWAAGVLLGPNDRVTPDRQTPVPSGQAIIVQRARPVLLVADGQHIAAASAETDPRAVLSQAGIGLTADDLVVQDFIEAGGPLRRITVIRVTYANEVVSEIVPYLTERRPTAELPLGTEREVRAGMPGAKQVTYRVRYEGGVVASRERIDEEVMAPAVSRIVEVGTAGTIKVGGETLAFSRQLTVTATAYTPGPESTGPYSDGFTAIGLKAQRGIIAVDPRVISLRTRVYVEGYGLAIAGDVGGAIRGQRIDVCVDTVAEALRWGRRTVRVYILR